jgi:hypothetical protein
MIAVPIQKPPYDERAVAPKVLPVAISLRIMSVLRFASGALPRLNLPHASEKLDETTVSESSTNNNVGLGETAGAQVNA